ncbi:MAG: oligosaccharide flippase family protein [Bacteroidia bacterium]|nr:oligosaccharide flippase family protein [Bacteroidia bacterium]
MGIIIRQSVKNSLVTYIGVIIGTINVLFLFNKFLSTEQFGIYTLLTSYPIVFASISNFGAPNILVRFFNRFKNLEEKHNGILGNSLFLSLIGYCFFLVLYFRSNSLFENIYGKESPLLIEYFWVFPIFTFFIILQSNLEAYCRVHLRIVFPAIVREIFHKGFNSILAIMFSYQLISFNQLIFGMLISLLIGVLGYLFYIKFVLHSLFLKLDFSFVKKPIFKEIYLYGFWIFIAGSAASTLPHIEKFFLPANKGGLEPTSIFAIALNIALVISIPRNAVAAISEPLIAESWNQNNLKNIEEIYKKSSLNLLIIGVLLFLGIWCNVENIFNIIPNTSIYSKGKIVVLLVGLYCLVDMATGLNSEMIRHSTFYKYDFYFFLLRFSFLTFANIYLIPMYSYVGAAWAMLVSGVFYNVVKYIFIFVKFNMQPFRAQTIYVLLLGLFTFTVASMVPSFGSSVIMNLLNIVVRSFVILILFVGGIAYFKMSDELDKIFNQCYTIFRNRFLK